MPFGFGRQKTSSRSESIARGFSVGGSSSRSAQDSGSTSRSGGSSSSSVAFADVFARLFEGAEGAAGRAAQLVPELRTASSDLFNAGTGFLDRIGGGAGTDFLADQLINSDALVEDEISQLQSDVGRFFDEELIPETVDRAVGAGQLGGGREGVAVGRAIDTAGREFSRGALDIRTAARDRNAGIARDLAALEQSGGAAGIQALPTLLGAAESGIGAEFSVFDRLAGILGGPTVLTDSEQFAESDAFSIARAIADSLNLSEDFAKSTSTSSGSGFSFNFAGK